jgi:hypothetical protein
VNKLRWLIVRGEEVGVSLDVANRGSGRQSSVGEGSIGLESLGSVREDTGTGSQRKTVANPLGAKSRQDGWNHHSRTEKLGKGEHCVWI